MKYNIEEKEQRHCLECGSTFEYSRSSKKFCDESCKNHYHNRINSETKHMHTKTNGQINKNYEILKMLLKNKVRTIDITDIEEYGFKAECCTSYRKVRSHNEYRCYEIKYYLSDSKIFGIEAIDRKNLPSSCIKKE